MRGRLVAAVVIVVAAALVVGVRSRHSGGPTRVGTGAVVPAGDQGGDQSVEPVAPDPEVTTSTSSPATSTTTTSIDLGVTDRLEVLQPLVHVLPHDTTHYRIDYRVEAANHLVLTITLLAILNHDYQRATYQAQLRQYKAEALDFLRAQGTDPAAYSITYEPPEAAAL